MSRIRKSAGDGTSSGSVVQIGKPAKPAFELLSDLMARLEELSLELGLARTVLECARGIATEQGMGPRTEATVAFGRILDLAIVVDGQIDRSMDEANAMATECATLSGRAA